MLSTLLDSLDRSLGMVYRIGAKRIAFVVVTLLVIAWWFRKGADARAVDLLKKSARLINSSFTNRDRLAAIADVGAAVALIDAANQYEANKSRLARAVGGVNVADYRQYAESTLAKLMRG